MLFKQVLIIVGSILLIFCPIIMASETSSPVVYGDILEVFEAEGKVRLRTNESMLILEMHPSCEVFRFGLPTTVAALHPITLHDFQDGLFFLNSDGYITHVFVNYVVHEIQGQLISYDIFGNIKSRQPLQ